MSNLHSTFTLRTERKHQLDTYLVKIHLVVHEILSVLYFLLCLVMTDGSHFGWSLCEKNLIPSQNDTSDTILALIHSEVLQKCHFHFFATFSNSSQQPSWISQWNKFERTLFADNSD